MRLKMSSAKGCLFSLGLNELSKESCLTCPFLAGLSDIRRRSPALGGRFGADWIPQATELGRQGRLES